MKVSKEEAALLDPPLDESKRFRFFRPTLFLY